MGSLVGRNAWVGQALFFKNHFERYGMGELVSFGEDGDDNEYAVVWFSSKRMHVCFTSQRS